MLAPQIQRLVSVPMTVSQWLGAFLGVVWIRYALEAFSSPSASGFLPIDLSTLVHYTLFYLAAILLSVWLVSLALSIDASAMTRALIFVLPIMWTAPLIDIAFGGARMTYIFSADVYQIGLYLVTYFGSFSDTGVTIGQRLELVVLILLFAAYSYAQTRRRTAALAAAGLQYLLLFALACMPSVLMLLLPGHDLVRGFQDSLIAHSAAYPADLGYGLRTVEVFFNTVMSQILYILLCIAGIGWLSRVDAGMLQAVKQNLRPERMAHFVIMAVLGGLLAVHMGAQVQWTVFDIVTVTAALIAILFACVFAIAVNDLVDVSIDAVSNKSRPLVTGALSPAQMRQVGGVSAGMTLFGGLALGPYSLFFLGVFTAAYYVYSAPPLRLKRIPVFSSSLIGLASLSMLLLGFYLVAPDQQLATFPADIGILVVLAMTLITNVRDLKDVEGDGRAGIWTLPTLLGEARARWVMGAMTLVAYALVPLVIPVAILWPISALVGVVSWVGLVRGGSEKLIFTSYFCYIAVLVTVLSVIS